MDELVKIGDALALKLVDIGVSQLGAVASLVEREFKVTKWQCWPASIRHESVAWLPLATTLALNQLTIGETLWLANAKIGDVSILTKGRAAVQVVRLCGPSAAHVINMVILATAASTNAGRWSIEWLESTLQDGADQIVELVGAELGLEQMLRCRTEFEAWNNYIVAATYRTAMQLHQVSVIERCQALLGVKRSVHKKEMRNFCRFITGNIEECEISLDNPYLWGVARELVRAGCPQMQDTKVVKLTRSVLPNGPMNLAGLVKRIGPHSPKLLENGQIAMSLVLQRAIGYHTLRLAEVAGDEVIVIEFTPTGINMHDIEEQFKIAVRQAHVTCIDVATAASEVQALFCAIICDYITAQYSYAEWAAAGTTPSYEEIDGIIKDGISGPAHVAYWLVTRDPYYIGSEIHIASCNYGMAWIIGHVYIDPAEPRGWISYLETDIDESGRVYESKTPFIWQVPHLDKLLPVDPHIQPAILTDTTPPGVSVSFTYLEGRFLHTLLYRGQTIMAAEHTSRVADWLLPNRHVCSLVTPKTAKTISMIQAVIAKIPPPASVICVHGNMHVRVFMSHYWNSLSPSVKIGRNGHDYDIYESKGFVIDDIC